MNTNTFLKVISKNKKVPLFLKKPIIKRCKRTTVHKNGWWHYSVLVNLVRVDQKGNLQILVQKRSRSVDIAKGKYDQSLATQILFSDKTRRYSLYRGLSEELGINSNDIKFAEFLPKSNFFITKEYSDEKGILNREKMLLFVVTTTKLDIKPHCDKVNKIKWKNWNSYVNEIIKYQSRYTKTVRFFIKNTILKNKLEIFMYDFVKNKVNKKINSDKLNIHYISPQNNIDKIINL